MSEEPDKLKQLRVGIQIKCVYMQFRSYGMHLCLHWGASQNTFMHCLAVQQSLEQTPAISCSVPECAVLYPTKLAFK